MWEKVLQRNQRGNLRLFEAPEGNYTNLDGSDVSGCQGSSLV